MVPVTVPAAGTNQEPQGLNLIHTLGCKGCHIIQGDGSALGPDLTQIGSRMTAARIQALLIAPASIREKYMPDYKSVNTEDLEIISNYLYQLR